MKRKKRSFVPRAILREKMNNMNGREEEIEPWFMEAEILEKKSFLQSYPYTVFKEMHQHLFLKVMSCLIIILLVLLVNIFNIPAANNLGDSFYNLVVWNMDMTGLPDRAVATFNSIRGQSLVENNIISFTEEQKSSEKKMTLPVLGAMVLADYGIREHPVQGAEMHYGIELAAPPGSSVLAALDGVVVSLEDYLDYGQGLLLNHREGLETFYACINDIKVQKGDKVKQGDKIASIASRKDGEKAFLYFEVRINDRPVNPREVLPEE